MHFFYSYIYLTWRHLGDRFTLLFKVRSIEHKGKSSVLLKLHVIGSYVTLEADAKE